MDEARVGGFSRASVAHMCEGFFGRLISGSDL